MATDRLIRPQGLTVDIVIFTLESEELKILLIKRTKKPFLGSWALPGGFIFDNESSRNAALRILEKKLGYEMSIWNNFIPSIVLTEILEEEYIP